MFVGNEKELKREINNHEFDGYATREQCENVEISEMIDDQKYERNSTGMLDKECSFSVSVQGSFHQAHPMFGNTAGTQCVANCLAALAYNALKCARNWKTNDLNKILVTGDELYTYLQNSSSITNRYLLVEELPQYFECYNKTFDFSVKTVVPSLISLFDEEPCYSDFNAYPLLEGLQMALHETDGCFVCFGGNTLLIGKTDQEFFIFDSHARCPRGYVSFTGKSTRIIFKDVEEVFLHINH